MSRSAQLHHTGGPEPGETRSTGPEAAEEEDEEEEGEEDGDLDDEVDAARLEQFMRDRRRTRSLPAYPGALLEEGGPEPADRKRVKFADSMGLNLASVKHFSSLEEPRVPNKVLSRYRSFPPPPQHELLNDLCHSFCYGLSTGTGTGSGVGTGRLLPCFPEPQDPDVRVQLFRICLERITVTHFDLRGNIRVLRRGPDPEVGVRYTFNDWKSCVDAQALSVSVDEPGFVGQRFCFTVYPPPLMEPGSAVHFALYLRDRDGDFWDNNQGQNYTLRYRATGTGATPPARNHFHAI